MAREISLTGGDVSVLKALGLSGSAVLGNSLRERLGEMEDAEIIDTLQGLIMMDYVVTDASQLRRIEDVERATFKANANMIKELRNALHPGRDQGRERRRRRG